MIYITAVKSFQFNTTPGIRFGAEESKNTAEEVTKKLGKKILFIYHHHISFYGAYKSSVSLFSNLDDYVIDIVVPKRLMRR